MFGLHARARAPPIARPVKRPDGGGIELDKCAQRDHGFLDQPDMDRQIVI
jgi:hypothetical protein